MAVHTEYTLRGSSIAQILDLPFAVPASEALCAESLLARQDGEVFDLVPTRTAAVRAVAANQRPISQE